MGSFFMKTLPFLILSLFISLNSYAGVKEKKALRAFTEKAQSATEKIKIACGNATLTSEVNIEKKYLATGIYIAELNLADFVAGMLMVCKDADYKEEISKVQKLIFSATDNANKTGKNKKIYGEIKVVGEVMQIVLHIKYSLSNGQSNLVANAIKDLY